METFNQGEEPEKNSLVSLTATHEGRQVSAQQDKSSGVRETLNWSDRSPGSDPVSGSDLVLS